MTATEEKKVFVFSEERKHDEILQGEKKKVEEIIGKEYQWTDIKVVPDKFAKKEGDLVTILQFKEGEKTYVVFTRSTVLTGQALAMKESGKLPFKAKIAKQKRYLTFQ